MSSQEISTPLAPAAIGPYVQGRTIGNLLFTSGQIPLVPETMTLLEGDIKAQTELVLKNLNAILEAGGSSKDKVVKTTVFLKDMNDFAEVNRVYERFFAPHKPARSCVEVACLPKNCAIEIEAIASL